MLTRVREENRSPLRPLHIPWPSCLASLVPIHPAGLWKHTSKNGDSVTPNKAVDREGGHWLCEASHKERLTGPTGSEEAH